MPPALMHRPVYWFWREVRELARARGASAVARSRRIMSTGRKMDRMANDSFILVDVRQEEPAEHMLRVNSRALLAYGAQYKTRLGNSNRY